MAHLGAAADLGVRGDERLDLSGPAPIAAFCNPFKGGAPEAFVLTENESGWGHLRYLSMDAGGSGTWLLHNLPGLPSTATAVVATVRGHTVEAHWSDRQGCLWCISLTADGFGEPARYGLSSGVVRLAAAYEPTCPGRSEPVLHGTARQPSSQVPRLWLSSAAHPMTYYRMPVGFGSRSSFALSMVGRGAWVVDTAVDGELRRWMGHQGTSEVLGPLAYGGTSSGAKQVFGTYGPLDAALPRPLYLGFDGLPYAWDSRRGEVPLGDWPYAIRDIYAVRETTGMTTVYLTTEHGSLWALEQSGENSAEPAWGAAELVSGTTCSVIATTQAHTGRRTVFAVDADGEVLTAFHREPSRWCRGPSRRFRLMPGYAEAGVPLVHPASSLGTV